MTVFEQDQAVDDRPRDWNFGIYWSQDPLAECLPDELANQVEDAQVDDYRAGPDETMPIFNAETEELLKAIPMPYNIRLARKRFCRLISTGLDVRYGKRITEVSSDGKTATATFEDGSTETGDFLIGCEGAHSIVRRYLLGPEKATLTPLPIIASACMARLPVEAAQKFKGFAHRLTVNFHPKGYFFWNGLHDAYGDSKAGEWTFMMIMSWTPDDPNYDPSTLDSSAKILADMKERSKLFGPGLSYIIQSIPEDTRCWHNRLSYWVPEQWDNHNGTITLGGDAAHSMTFHRGQGLNNAINDVALLARKIKEKGFTAEAISAYEEEMIPRAREAVIGSTNNSLAVHDWDKLMQSPLMAKGLTQK